MIIINNPWLTSKNTIETQEICSLVTSGAGRVYHRGSLSLSSCGSSKWAVTFVITLLYHHPFIWLDYPRQIVSFYCRYRDHMAKMISRYLSAGFDFEFDNHQFSTSVIEKQLSDRIWMVKNIFTSKTIISTPLMFQNISDEVWVRAEPSWPAARSLAAIGIGRRPPAILISIGWP